MSESSVIQTLQEIEALSVQNRTEKRKNRLTDVKYKAGAFMLQVGSIAALNTTGTFHPLINCAIGLGVAGTIFGLGMKRYLDAEQYRERLPIQKKLKLNALKQIPVSDLTAVESLHMQSAAIGTVSTLAKENDYEGALRVLEDHNSNRNEGSPPLEQSLPARYRDKLLDTKLERDGSKQKNNFAKTLANQTKNLGVKLKIIKPNPEREEQRT